MGLFTGPEEGSALPPCDGIHFLSVLHVLFIVLWFWKLTAWQVIQICVTVCDIVLWSYRHLRDPHLGPWPTGLFWLRVPWVIRISNSENHDSPENNIPLGQPYQGLKPQGVSFFRTWNLNKIEKYLPELVSCPCRLSMKKSVCQKFRWTVLINLRAASSLSC